MRACMCVCVLHPYSVPSAVIVGHVCCPVNMYHDALCPEFCHVVLASALQTRIVKQAWVALGKCVSN